MRYVLLLVMLAAPAATPCLAVESPDPADSAQRLDGIAARYHRLLERRPQRGTAFDLLYRHYLDAGRLDAQVEIGQIQVRQGKLKTAVATFESCLDSVNPGSWLAKDIQRRIESVFLRRNDLSGLTQYYRARLQQRPQDLDVMVRLAATTSRLGSAAAAIEQYRAAVKLAPTRTDLREQLIAELERASRGADARAELEQLVAEHPRDVNYLQRLGQLYEVERRRGPIHRLLVGRHDRVGPAPPDDRPDLCAAGAGTQTR